MKDHATAGITPQRMTLRQRTLAAVLLALASTAAAHDHGTGQGAAMAFDLPAQPLADALRSFAQQVPAKPMLDFDASLLAGKRAPALKGSYHPRDALEQLLAGSGLVIVRAEQGTITLAAADAPAAAKAQDGHPAITLPQVTVQAHALPGQTENSGSYTPDAVTVGGKTEQSLREIPRSISTITRTQIEDQGMTTLEDALEQLPGVTISPAAMWSGATYTTRGFTIQNFLVDGSIVREYDAMDSSVNGSLGMYDSV